MAKAYELLQEFIATTHSIKKQATSLIEEFEFPK